MPTAMALAGMSLVTAARAPMTAPSPIVNRMKRLGRLEDLLEVALPRDWSTARDGGPRRTALPEALIEPQDSGARWGRKSQTLASPRGIEPLTPGSVGQSADCK
jgi:hypothetical protein